MLPHLNFHALNQRILHAKRLACVPTGPPMLGTVQEIAIYIHRFHNLDLFEQGWYRIKITMRLEDNDNVLVGMPSRVVQYEGKFRDTSPNYQPSGWQDFCKLQMATLCYGNRILHYQVRNNEDINRFDCNLIVSVACRRDFTVNCRLINLFGLKLPITLSVAVPSPPMLLPSTPPTTSGSASHVSSQLPC